MRSRRLLSKVLVLCMIATVLSTLSFTSVFASGISWPLGQLLPSFSAPAATLDVIDMSSLSNDDINMLVTLEGLVNRTQPRLACVLDTGEGKYTWLDDLNLGYAAISGWDAVSKYLSEIKGIVIYDTSRLDTLNLATTIAGVKDGIVASPAQAAILEVAPYNLPVIEDLRGRFADKYATYQYLHDNYWSQCTHRVIVGFNGTGRIRDYAVALKAAVVYLDSSVTADRNMLAQFFPDMTAGSSVYMGWWPVEQDGVSYAGTYGISTLAADLFTNATVYGGMSRSIDVKQTPAKPQLQNKIYVTMILSDGDNAQYCQHALRASWNNPDRGSVPIGWTITPLLLDMAPGMLDWYYDNATSNDCLISGPSGAGYCYPEEWSTSARNAYLNTTEKYLEATGLKVITEWRDMDSATGTAYAANCPSLLGLTSQITGDGTVTYNRMLPMVALSAPYVRTEADIETAIANASSGWSGTSPLFITVQGNAWYVSPTNLKNVMNSLNPNYVVVRPDHFFMLYREANNMGIYTGAGDNNQMDYNFKNHNTDGWLSGLSQKSLDAAYWDNEKAALALDGSDSNIVDSVPNSWFYKKINLPANATKLTFFTRSPDNTHGGKLRVRLVDSGGTSHTLMDWDSTRSDLWILKSLDISSYAGQTVTIYFEMNDSGSSSGEYRFVDNIRIISSGNDVNLGFDKTATASGTTNNELPEYSVDGSVINNSKWCYNYAGDKWLKLDLGQACNIDRWVVKHAGAGGESTSLNTSNFKLQSSNDGSSWTDVDTVINNTASITDRSVPEFNARYVRLYITDSGADNAARIYEFQVYGSRDARSQCEAESRNEQSGLIRAGTCSEGGKYLGWLNDGNYAEYYNVDFGTGITAFDARIGSPKTGGSIEVRLDSPTGTLVGTCTIPNTGAYQTYVTQACSISGATGTHNLYLVFKGGTDLANLNWFKFR